jgi:hypothetical protein
MSFTYTIQRLKGDLTAALHGTTLNRVQNVNGMIERAASDLLLELDPQETKRILPITTPIFNRVYDYQLPVDLKGTKIIDIRPQANRTVLDRYIQQYGQDFDISKAVTLNPNFAIQFNQGLKFIRIDNNLLPIGITLNQADSVTGNGTWTCDGTLATTPTQDSVNFVAGSSSVSFNLNAGANPSTGTITNSNMTAVDMTANYLQGYEFFYVYLPTASNFTSVTFKWGSDASNYWTSTQTTTQEGLAFGNGWNLIAVPWSGSTTVVGSPDYTNVNYLQVGFTYNGTAMNGVKINSFVSQLGTLSEIVYYSKYIFQDSSTGAFQETITDDSNIINLDTESRNLLYLLCGIYMTQQVQGVDAMFFDSNHFDQRYAKDLALYKSQYKSEWQKPRSTYYGMPNSSNKRFYNGNRFSY